MDMRWMPQQEQCTRNYAAVVSLHCGWSPWVDEVLVATKWVMTALKEREHLLTFYGQR